MLPFLVVGLVNQPVPGFFSFFTAQDPRGPRTETHEIGCWLFLRLLGAVYLAAFLSLVPQIVGLCGAHGILPAADYLSAVREQVGSERYALVPTLFWFGASDAALRLCCALGAALSVLLLCGVGCVPLLVALYALYLSLLGIGRDFLSFQWDILLLEAGFLAIFLVPLWPRRGPQRVAPAVLLLFSLLLFRLMFGSGAVKLLSGDPTWRDLSALHHHFETQPLPTLVGYYLHQFPGWIKTLSTALMFVIELAVPLLILMPSRVRRHAFFPLALLQVLIEASGNFAFFNWLTLALCMPLLPDSWLRRVFPGRWQNEPAAPRASRTSLATARRIVIGASFVGLAGLSFFQLAGPFLRGRMPGFARDALGALAPFHLVNRYGLFAVMTTTRPEIIIEGSNDQKTWRPYEFRYKPGDLSRRPGFIAPHQPRLDWQMWFAALGTPRDNPWFGRLCLRLLEGRPEVLSLLGPNPFPSALPPRYLRATVYDYHFTTLAEKHRTGDTWRRTAQGPYLPTVSLRSAE